MDAEKPPSPDDSKSDSAKADANKASRPSSSVGGSRRKSAVSVPTSPKVSRHSTHGSLPVSPRGSRAGSATSVSGIPKSAHSGSAASLPIINKSLRHDSPGSPKGSRPGSARGSRPASATYGVRSSPKELQMESAAVSRANSRVGSPTSSKEGSVKGGSRQGSRTSFKEGSRPGSKEGSQTSLRLGSKEGSRQGSDTRNADNEGTSSRPTSGRPPSAARPGSGRPTSVRPGSGRPTSGRPTSGRGASGIPKSTSKRGTDKLPPGDKSQDDSEENSGQTDPSADKDDGNDLLPDATNLTQLGGQGGSGSGDGGSDEDEDEDEDGEDVEEDEISDDEEESDGEETVILAPDHPLMQRFQKALRMHLDKQNEKMTLELRELMEAVKNKGTDRETIGVELYGVQQELARYQMMLEQNHDQFAELSQMRAQQEHELVDVQQMYRTTQQTVNSEKKKGSELQQEVENLALRLFYMDNAKEDVRSDIAVMRRAAEKADSKVSKAELDKQKQDLFVNRLIERVDKLRENIALYEAQMISQSLETKATREALSEAHMEIEAINLEKKQLYQQWTSSLIGMRRRDEAHSAMLDALNEQQQLITSLENEIDGFKKSISAEQEQNEKLMTINSKTENDIQTLRRLLQTCQDKHDALKNEYATYSRMLHETEQALNRATTDKTLKTNELKALMKQIEREYQEKMRLEDEILEMLRSQLTLDKAAHYTDRLTGKMRDRTKDLDTQLAEAENQLSKDTLEISNTRMRVERLHGLILQLDEEIQAKNNIITRSEKEMLKRSALIERKQGIIDQFNKKIEQLINSSGGVELGPIEMELNSLQKSVDAEQAEIGELQQMWLRDQSELVRLTQDKETQVADVETLKKQLTILSQKKLRIEGDINHQLTDTRDIERNISRMQNDMLKLNIHLHKERGMEHILEQGNLLMENDFIGNLREAELNSINMQTNLDSLKEEKERLLNSLVEAERQIMLWEKKIQLARETRTIVDSDSGQGEIRAMKSEIHRMQVRYNALMKQQEKMIQEMEKAVSRRDTIVTRGSVQSKSNKAVTKGVFQRQLGDQHKKIKSTISEADQCDMEIKHLREDLQELSEQAEHRQVNMQQLQGTADALDGEVDLLQEQKQKNLQDLLKKQQRTKYYQQVKDGKYTRICKTDSALHHEQQKQDERMQTLAAIVDRLNQEYPHAAPSLRKVTLSLQVRLAGEE